MTKKLKILITVASCAILLIASVVAVAMNYHRIYVFAETRGWFRQSIGINGTDVVGTSYSFDEMAADPRITVDQSLMLVNTEYTLPEDYEADVLEYKDTTVYMSRCMLESYARLSAAVSEKTGKKLYVSSDFRTAEEQEELYREDPLTATLPGASEHQTGLALDVYVAKYSGDAFVKSVAGRFVNSHSWEYGFIIRYPSYGEDVTGIRFEPWHIRYVGHPHADVIYKNHTTLEEYIWGIEIGDWYEIDGYLVSRQKPVDGCLILPCEFESCVISPDNTGCYIITVRGGCK